MSCAPSTKPAAWSISPPAWTPPSSATCTSPAWTAARRAASPRQPGMHTLTLDHGLRQFVDLFDSLDVTAQRNAT